MIRRDSTKVIEFPKDVKQVRILAAMFNARKKGLRVVKNSLLPGFCISLPDGSCYHAATSRDMVAYVKDY